jgi:signal transduction histidine kinase/ActR/RegA family two-component response regulator
MPVSDSTPSPDSAQKDTYRRETAVEPYQPTPLQNCDSIQPRNLSFDFNPVELNAMEPALESGYQPFDASAEMFVPRTWNTRGLDINEGLQRALDVCEAAFDDIVDKSADGVVVVNPVGTICFANAAAQSMLGRSLDELWGEPFGVPVKPGEIVEINLPSPEPGPHVAEIRVVATHWQGEPALLATLRDVTQRKQALHRRDEFLAVLSHELRNPLAAISNAASVLGRDDLDEDTFANARTVIERQCGQMTRLLSDLLDVSRATRGKIELRKECLDLVDVIIEAGDAVRRDLDTSGQTLSIVSTNDSIPVDGDAVRLQQVLVNLLSNASKFSDAGTTIKLSAGIEDDEAVIRVRDQGIGMSAEMLDAVFQPFMQLDSSHDRAAEGLGLGLAIVDGLVRLHGGTVQASSEGRGKGSEFCVRLPLSKSRPDIAPPPTVVADGEPLRVVIVEDNVDVRSMLKTLLEHVGHQVEIAVDGLSGAELIERLRPDVALVDIGLPKMNGYQLARRIRDNDAHRDVYLAALTGYGQPADQERALSSGFDAHVAKPVSLDQLRKLLGSRRHSRAAEEQARV